MYITIFFLFFFLENWCHWKVGRWTHGKNPWVVATKPRWVKTINMLSHNWMVLPIKNLMQVYVHCHFRNALRCPLKLKSVFITNRLFCWTCYSYFLVSTSCYPPGILQNLRYLCIYYSICRPSEYRGQYMYFILFSL